jgi:hypothetical protein
MKNGTSSSLRTAVTIDNLSGLLRPSVVVGIIYVAFIGLFALLNHYSAFDFIQLGTVWGNHDPSGTWGYDGQFYYQIARNPLQAYRYMDNAPFREQHILYPLVVGALSLGQVALIPYMLLLVNILSVVFSVEILAHLLRKYGFSPWFSLALGLYFGQIAGTMFDTAESFTYVLVFLGIWFVMEKGKTAPGASMFGLAGLAREIAILFPLAYAGYYFVRGQWKACGQMIVLGILPLVAWLIALRLIFGQTGLTFTRPFEHIPFADIFYYAGTPKKFYLLLLMMFLPTVGAWVLAIREAYRVLFVEKGPFLQRFSPIYLFLLANLIMITFMSHYSFEELISCGRIATGLVLSVLLYGITTKDKRVLWASQFYTFTFVVFAIGVLIHLPSFII